VGLIITRAHRPLNPLAAAQKEGVDKRIDRVAARLAPAGRSGDRCCRSGGAPLSGPSHLSGGRCAFGSAGQNSQNPPRASEPLGTLSVKSDR
jgi:hypothetical protein